MITPYRLTLILSVLSTSLWAQTNCTFTVTPDRFDLDKSGGDAGIKVVGSGPCPWTSSSDAAWISEIAKSVSNNEGSVLFTAVANQGPERTATLTVAGKAIPVRQAAGTSGPAGPSVTNSGVVNGASYAMGGLVPGAIISIFGDNLGPVTIVTLQVGADGRTLFTSLGGTRVLIDGVAAPLIFSSKTQVSAIVPYVISTKTLVDVQVEYQNAVSAKVTMPIALAGPALFALNGQGTGPGAILNQDNSVNSATRSARPGEVISLFATGDGLREPLPADGELTPRAEPLPRTKLPVQVTVGGRAGEVLYAGGAPGLTAGLLQVNVRLPMDVTLGTSVPVVLNVGGASSPATVTVAISRP